MGSVYGEFKDTIRVGIVCPWFAGWPYHSACSFIVLLTIIVDTAIVSTGLKVFMAGIPLTPISRIGGAIFKAATDVDPETNGAIYTLPDHGETFRLNRAQLHLHEGVYKLLNDRAQLVLRSVLTALLLHQFLTITYHFQACF
jgi:hypothetical protein